MSLGAVRQIDPKQKFIDDSKPPEAPKPEERPIQIMSV